MTKSNSRAIGIAVLAAVACLSVSAQQNQMSFFITSAGPGQRGKSRWTRRRG